MVLQKYGNQHFELSPWEFEVLSSLENGLEFTAHQRLNFLEFGSGKNGSQSSNVLLEHSKRSMKFPKIQEKTEWWCVWKGQNDPQVDVTSFPWISNLYWMSPSKVLNPSFSLHLFFILWGDSFILSPPPFFWFCAVILGYIHSLFSFCHSKWNILQSLN